MPTLRNLLAAVGCISILIAGSPREAYGDQAAIDEYQVKAAFLYNFAKFVQWPQEAFTGDSDRISICIVGANPFGTSLENAVRDKVVAGRTFVIRMVKGAGEAASCHILFVGDSEQKLLSSLLSPLQGSSTLTVGESDDFIAKGGLIHFRIRASHVRIEINLAGAARSKCRISSKLLSMSDAPAK